MKKNLKMYFPIIRTRETILSMINQDVRLQHRFQKWNEKQQKEFLDYPNQYIHRIKHVADTGIELELLQKYIFIPLDIYKEVSHNNPIENELEAWLTFLCKDDVDSIIQLIEKYPDFKPLYETLYRMCENIEGVMNMFSEELYELDKNTAEFMVDEFSRVIEEQKALLAEKDSELAEKDAMIAELLKKLEEQKA